MPHYLKISSGVICSLNQRFTRSIWLPINGLKCNSFMEMLATSVKSDDQTDTIVINNKERKDLAFLTGQCKFDGSLFCFFLFPAKKKKETPPTLQTLPKPHEPTLKPKLCQRVQSCRHTVIN